MASPPRRDANATPPVALLAALLLVAALATARVGREAPRDLAAGRWLGGSARARLSGRGSLTAGGGVARRLHARALSDDVQKQMRGLPKKRRGRPPKQTQDIKSVEESSPETTATEENANPEEAQEGIEETPPPVVAIIGASGRLGSEIVRQFKTKPSEFIVRAVVRNKFDERANEAGQWLGTTDTMLEADVAKPSTLREALEGADIVVFAAGAGAGGGGSQGANSNILEGISEFLPKELNDLTGALPKELSNAFDRIPAVDKVADAVLFGGFERVDNRGVANVAAICAGQSKSPSRLILISSIGVTRFPLVQLAGIAGDALQQKRKGEKAVEDSGLPYTIIRPGGLLSESRDRNQKLRLTQGDTDFGSVTREDVAKACVEIVRRPSTCLDSTFEIVGDASTFSDLDWNTALESLLPDYQVKSPTEKMLNFDPFNPEGALEKILEQLPPF